MDRENRSTVALAVGLGLFIGWGVGLPGTAAATPADRPARGLYMKYCSACHGPGGKGDGSVSSVMRPKPTDLTQIAKKSGGEFPFVPIMQVIDGTKAVHAHGEADMPVWGELLKDPGSGSLESRVAIEGKLMLITDYIRSIQEK